MKILSNILGFFQRDDTDKLAVSINGMGTVAGDSPLRMSVAVGSTLASQPLAAGLILADGANPRPVAAATQIGFASGGGNILPALMVAYNAGSDNYDPWVPNVEGTLLASAARTVTTNSADFVNRNSKNLVVYINVTAAPAAAATLIVALQGKDPVSGSYSEMEPDLPAMANTDGVRPYVFIFGPGVTETPGATGRLKGVAKVVVPRTWRINISHNNAESWTYSVGYSLIL